VEALEPDDLQTMSAYQERDTGRVYSGRSRGGRL